MKLKKLLKYIGGDTFITLGIDGAPVCTQKKRDIKDKYFDYEVVKIWAGRTAYGDSKINITLEVEK